MHDDAPADLLAAAETAQKLTHNASNTATGGIWRLRGAAGSRILKIAKPGTDDLTLQWSTSTEPTHFNYWQRESLAYRGGLAASAYADAGIRGPRLLDAVDRPDGSVAFWLEDVAGEPGASWTTAELRSFCEQLGTGQAAWVGRELPYPWLSRRWLHQYAGRRPLTAPVDWDHPIVAAAWPTDLRTGLAKLAANRDELLAVADRAPRTLAHLDVWPMNMIGTPTGPVLLDWAFVGDGAIGEDISNLIVDSIADGLVPVSRLDEVAEAAVDGYLAGVGGVVDEATVRHAVRATGAAKYAAFGPTIARRVADGGRVASVSYDVGGSLTDLLERWRPMLALLVAWGQAALTP